MKRVLFVDDEPNILSGLRRMLRGQRNEWEMDFQPSGLEALKAMEEQPFDIVVSDMKMPGMDGAELLSEVQRLYPNTIRIILSGQSELSAILKSIGPTHQFLAKPCDPERLKRVVDRAYELRELLNDQDLKHLVSKLETIPSLPRLYQEVVRELQVPNASLERIGRVIEKDIAMSAKILKMVNSAYFGLQYPVTAIDRAINFLGLETVTTLILGAHVFDEANVIDVEGLSLEELWEQGVKVSAVSRVVARELGVEKQIAEEAYTAGMLHGVGRLVLLTNLPESYADVLRRARQGNMDLLDAEHEVFGACHTTVGAYLMGLWGLPDSIVESVAFHARPSGTYRGFPDCVTIVHVANAVVLDPDSPWGTLDEGYIADAGLGDRIEGLVAESQSLLDG